MGAGQTKEKQLDRFGQLLSAQEKVAVSSSFQAIAGSSEVNFFVESQLQVSGRDLQCSRTFLCVLYADSHTKLSSIIALVSRGGGLWHRLYIPHPIP